MGSFPLPGHLSRALKETNTGVVTYRTEHTGSGRAEDGAEGTEVDVSAGSDFGLTSTGERTAHHPGHPGSRGLRRLQCPSLHGEHRALHVGSPVPAVWGAPCPPCGEPRARCVGSSHLEVNEPGFEAQLNLLPVCP